MATVIVLHTTLKNTHGKTRIDCIGIDYNNMIYTYVIILLWIRSKKIYGAEPYTGYHPVLCDVDSASSGHGLEEECCECGNELSGFMLRVKFLGWLRNNTCHKNCVCAASCIRRRTVERL